MPQTLAQQLVDDVAAVFLDPEHFGETVTFYTDRNAHGREITAIVQDLGQQKDDSGHHYLEGHVIHVSAARNGTSGFLPTELQVGARLSRANDVDPSVLYDFLEIVAGQTDTAMITARFRRSQLRLQGQHRPRQL